MKGYIIIEHKEHLPDGTVPHDIVEDDVLIMQNISYTQARNYVASRLDKDDTIIERYESTGQEVKSVGCLP